MRALLGYRNFGYGAHFYLFLFFTTAIAITVTRFVIFFKH